MPIGTICLDCGEIVLEAEAGRCLTCLRVREDARARRLRAREEKKVESKARRVRHQKVINSKRWRDVARYVRARDGECVNCGSKKNLTVHHTIPAVSSPNPYDPDLCVTLCRSCHGFEEARLARVRAGRRGGAVERGRTPDD